MSALETTSNTAPMLRAALRLTGWSGLGLIAVAVALSRASVIFKLGRRGAKQPPVDGAQGYANQCEQYNVEQ